MYIKSVICKCYDFFCLISDEQYNLGLLTRWGWGTDGDRSPTGGVDCSTPQGRRHRIPGQGAPHQNQGARRGTGSHHGTRTDLCLCLILYFGYYLPWSNFLPFHNHNHIHIMHGNYIWHFMLLALKKDCLNYKKITYANKIRYRFTPFSQWNFYCRSKPKKFTV